MWTWLTALPIPVQIGIYVGFLVLVVILAIIGRVTFKMGKWNVSFGKPPKAKKRMCTDCRTLVMTRTMKFDHDVKMLRDDILRDQMNYAEQKMLEVSYMLTSSYRQDIVDARKPGARMDISRENKEYIIYQESLGCAMIQIKNALRRAFKENGFFELGSNEFEDYIVGKTKLLISIGKEYIRSRYPFENMIVPIEERFSRTPESKIQAAVHDVFSKAKLIVKSTHEKIEELASVYDEDMDKLGRT